ncbi:type I restriction/modification system specificity determinant HsdS [Mycobacterium kubicae]|uniref:Restriction endonuclease subunit S n=1 Tax=Mycobacterium kubicae TaxID=120959 RepID=A0AAX1JGQ2_9MYCO|nr:restriction endonuclease subunit S [Mycobacterium kubicae]MCV7097054.1 restriction endonuclease subunit S [Mycobacterium kubicae]ORW03213.1 restriction endonuclease subunit S [Mycobacterium kubicae]QNI11467.1 restriction endonuclease subunit S [Mycobacterium kubicae]QPI39686.1 restriction endonuclease subunit S [Mycobacterium kubicae]GFG64306.1 type I restriction/modification system specificity determinant HsdS [Mycobacterium kubicae]
MEVTLGECLDFRTGSSAPARAATGRFAVYGANGVIGYAPDCNASGPLIVLGRVGSYCGSVRYSASDVWVTDNAFVCRAEDPAQTRYWYYALQTCRLNEHRCGSGQPLLNQRTLREVTVRTVPRGLRGAIAEVLGALDDKIAVNHRVIESAEAVMVATVATVVAAGQRVALSTLATRSTAVRTPAAFDPVVAHFSLPAFDDGAQPQPVAAASVKSGKYILSQPCVLFAKLNPHVPRIWNVVSLPAQMALASTEFVVLRPTGIDTSALWAALRQRDVVDSVRQLVAGTSGSHQRIQPRDLLEIAVADVRALSRDQSQLITDLGALCQARRAEKIRLAAVRDTLLPLLVSGQVGVATGTAGGVVAAGAGSHRIRAPR